jgi:hypothetical protein
MKTLQISEAAYESLVLAAKNRGITLEQVVDQMIAQFPVIYATNEDDFFRQLGASDEEIAQSKKDAELLPENPDW